MLDTTADSLQTDVPLADLGPLAWVFEELRKSLEGANKAIRRFVRESENARHHDLEAVDPSPLRLARQQLHQAVGALEMVGLEAPAHVLRAMEAAVQRFVQRPLVCTDDAAAKVERAGFALVEYLEAVLNNKPVQPVALFAQYREVQELAAAERVHPADLWQLEHRGIDVPAPRDVAPLRCEPPLRSLFDRLVLLVVKTQSVAAAQQLTKLSAGLSAGAGDARSQTFWRVAAAYFEAMAHQLLPADVYVKRAASRILLQFATFARDESQVSETLLHDLLFFCAQAQPSLPDQTPHLSAVRKAYGLTTARPVDYQRATLGRYDPALLTQARKRIAAAKEAWSLYAGGDQSRARVVVDQFGLVSDSLLKLHPDSTALAQALIKAADQAAHDPRGLRPELAMEVATTTLYLEAAFDDFDPADAEMAERTRSLAARLEGVLAGAPAQPLDGWMEQLYRRVSDRQTMGSVVGELKVSLGEAEKCLDQFFRTPQEKGGLHVAVSQLAQMRGVLSVLGLDQAVQTVSRMRATVDQILDTEVDENMAREAGTFQQLGNNLSALSFLVDMLNYQPSLARKLFVFNEEKGELVPVMGRRAVVQPPQATLSEEAEAVIADVQPSMDEVHGGAGLTDPSQPSDAVADQALLAEQPDAPPMAAQPVEVESPLAGAQALVEPVVPTPALASAKPAAPAPSLDEHNDDDDDLLDIFLEEAREVAINGLDAIGQLQAHPGDLEHLTTLRRAFHTLKGSSRMVGLGEYGEAAWAMEQLLNAVLAEQRSAHPHMLRVADEAMRALSQWTEDIASSADVPWSAQPFRTSAEAWRNRGEYVPLVLPTDLAPAPAPEQAAVEVQDELAGLSVDRVTDSEPTADPIPEDGFQAPAELVDIPAFDENAWADAPAFAEVAGGSQEEPLVEHIDFDALTTPSTAEVAADESATSLASETSEADRSSEADGAMVQAAADEVVDLSAPADTPWEAEEPAEAVSLEFELDFDLPDAGTDELAQAPVASSEPAPLSEIDFDIDFDAPDFPSDAGLVLDTAEATPPGEPAAAPFTLDAAAEPWAVETGDPLFAQPVDAFSDVEDIAPPSEAPATPHAVLLEEPEAADVPAVPDQPVEPSFTDLPVDPPPPPPLGEMPDDQTRVIGSLRIGIKLYNVFLNEADEWSRRLGTTLTEWSMERHQVLPDQAEALAHSLAGSSATVGFSSLSVIARALEHALESVALHQQAGLMATEHQAQLFVDASEDIRRLLHQFAAGFLKDPNTDLLEALYRVVHEQLPEAAAASESSVLDVGSVDSLETELSTDLSSLWADDERQPVSVASEPVVTTPELTASVDGPVVETSPIAAPHPLASSPVQDIDDDIDAVDIIDVDLFPIFSDEALELLPQMGGALRQWVARPDNGSARAEVLRNLHTFKGSARLAGTLRLGEMAHRMETTAERLGSDVQLSADLEPLLAAFDALSARFELLRQRDPVDNDVLLRAAEEAPEVPLSLAPSVVDTVAVEPFPEAPVSTAQETSKGLDGLVLPRTPVAAQARAGAAVRVRPELLDRLVNQAGEVMITRSRMESELVNLRGSLKDLTGNLDRLRQQLRDIELQAETQMQSRLAQARDADQSFDPLEFDRFTRVQELTRMMAESVNDVATVQRNLQRAVESTEDSLVAQARQTRELQRDLLRTRMVEFEGISERLYRVVRQASKETGKQVRLDITGGNIELDRGVLDRMTGAFEHLLRNCVVHGIETPQQRLAAGKPAEGRIEIRLAQELNDVSVVFHDDGAGLDLVRLREKAEAQGFINPGAQLSDKEAAQLVFAAGLSTADEVSGLAGRGVGMDVVRTDVVGLGGRVETETQAGQGTSFKLVLPLTTAVTQVVMVRAGSLTLGVPSNLVELVRRVSQDELAKAYAKGSLTVGSEEVPFHWAGALLQSSPQSLEAQGRTLPVVIFRSAAQRVAVHVDEVLGNQEVVVKNLGPQLSRLPGLAGMSVLASGAVALIYNPVALAAVYGSQVSAWLATQQRVAPQEQGDSPAPVDVVANAVPLVLVVDDSITVRRVTQRLLQREGYRVSLAADGLQALERLQQELPTVVLSDIEMPRMDGFDLVRNIRGDARLSSLPVIMITSRIAEKHREHARELGVDHYLGKPYAEDELLALVGHYAKVAAET